MPRTKKPKKKPRRTKTPTNPAVRKKLPLRDTDMKIPKLNHKDNHRYRTKVPGRIGTVCYNVGGYIINPPKLCPHRKISLSVSEEINCHVVDVGCCISSCVDKCDFFKWWRKASTKQRASWSLRNGIINPSMTSKKVR